MTDKSWFFPDSYLREMEALCVELRKANGQPVPDSIAISEVLVMAQAFGAWKQGQVEKAGGINAWLKGERAFGHGRVEQRNKHYFKALNFVSNLEVDHVEVEPEAEVAEETSVDLSTVWVQFKRSTSRTPRRPGRNLSGSLALPRCKPAFRRALLTRAGSMSSWP